MRRKVLFLSLLLSLFTTAAFGLGIRATWNANSESDLAGYKVYYGVASRTYGAPIVLGKVTTCDINNLSDGKSYFVAVTAYDSAGNESGYSEEASITLPDVTPPTPPTKPSLSIIDRIVRWFKALFRIV